MASRRDGAGSVSGLGRLPQLFGAGTVAGLSDRQLLDRFAARAGEPSDLAFGALVERHGPMVLRACRSVLGDEHDALDAFQATFLVLARRGGSVWVRDSVGPWLHRVALRAAGRARRAAGRRREVERRAAILADAARREPDREGIALVHEEVDRLPDRFRVPVVLCDLEGRTYEEAARQLGCPVGTVRSRLARARERLRDRLVRRGLAPAALLAAAEAGAASLPESLIDATVAAAVRPGAVPASAAALTLTRETLRAMSLTRWKWAATLLLAAGASLGGLATVAAPLARQAPATPPARTEADPKPAPAEPLAWRRIDKYVPPDYNGFFPDDPEGAARLKALWNAPDKDKRPDDEILRTVRQGLRRLDRQLDLPIIRWFGNRYVWGQSPQNPDAIEILYHASGHPTAPGAQGGFDAMRHWAVYFGLSTVEPKTPSILHALADLCLVCDDPNDLDRIAWGTRSQRAEVLGFVTPHLASPDRAEREKAQVVARILKGEVKAFAWAAERNKAAMRAKFGARLPEIKAALGSDDAARRREAFRLTLDEGLTAIMDDSFLPLLGRFADDPDQEVRDQVAKTVGGRWIWNGDPQNTEAIALALKLSRDPVYQVRYDAIYYGLARIPGKKGEEIVWAMLDFGLSFGFMDMHQMIAQGLEEDRAEAAKVLDEALRGPDPRRAKAAREVYQDMAGKAPPPPSGEPAPPPGRYTEAFRDLYETLGRSYPNFAMKGIDWPKVGEELLPLAEKAKTDDEFGLLVERLVARLEDTHAAVLPGSAKPPVPDLPRWDPGLACTIDDRGRPVVYDVARGSSADKAGIKPGQAVVSADGVPAPDLIDAWMTRTRTYVGYSSDRALRYDAVRGFLQQSKRGARLTLVLEDPAGRRTTAAVEATMGPRYLPRLPVPKQGIDDSADVSGAKLDGGIGYLYVRRIPAGLESKIDGALKSLGEIQGLILDVRGNSGGGFDAATAFGNFDPSPEAAKLAAGRPRFTGPIALLIDERTTSAGEGWASWFVARKRARLFGTASNGASSRKVTYKLTNGLYQVVIPVKAYTGFLDRPIERRGLEPDVEVRPRASDLAEGRDTVVEAAVGWLKTAGGK